MAEKLQEYSLTWEVTDEMTAKRIGSAGSQILSEEECEHWERMLGIKLTGEETLDDRRRNVKGIWTSGLPYTAKKFTEVLDAMVGPECYLLDINKKTKTLKVDLMLDVIMKVDYIYNLMRAMAPADMIVSAFYLWAVCQDLYHVCATQLEHPERLGQLPGHPCGAGRAGGAVAGVYRPKGYLAIYGFLSVQRAVRVLDHRRAAGHSRVHEGDF